MRNKLRALVRWIQNAVKRKPRNSTQPVTGTPHWVKVALVSALFGALFGALFSIAGHMWYETWVENHPDTIIYHWLAGDGPYIMSENRGEAVDKVRVEITLDQPDDSIVGINVSEPTSVKLIRGGFGESYATFTIDELWPHVSQFIHIGTSSNTKIAAAVKGYSLPEGSDIEEMIAVITVP